MAHVREAEGLSQPDPGTLPRPVVARVDEPQGQEVRPKTIR